MRFPKFTHPLPIAGTGVSTTAVQLLALRGLFEPRNTGSSKSVDPIMKRSRYGRSSGFWQRDGNKVSLRQRGKSAEISGSPYGVVMPNVAASCLVRIFWLFRPAIPYSCVVVTGSSVAFVSKIEAIGGPRP